MNIVMTILGTFQIKLGYQMKKPQNLSKNGKIEHGE